MDQYDKKSKIRRVLGELNAPTLGVSSGSTGSTPTAAMVASSRYRFDG